MAPGVERFLERLALRGVSGLIVPDLPLEEADEIAAAINEGQKIALKDDKGNITHWSMETFSPGKLVHMGWTQDCIKPGDQVSITLNPAKNGSPVGYLLKLVFADGRELGTQEQR